jgi:hypothetical protein
LLWQTGGVRNLHWTVRSQHKVEDGIRAWQLAHRMVPAGFHPDTALVGKAETCRSGLKVLASQTGDGVVTGLWRGIENPRGMQSSQTRIFQRLIHSASLWFHLYWFHWQHFYSCPEALALA